MSTVWAPEIKRVVPHARILLVGITGLEIPEKSENENDNVLPIVTQREGEAKAREIGALRYLECDLNSTENVRDVFLTAVRVCLAPVRKRWK